MVQTAVIPTLVAHPDAAPVVHPCAGGTNAADPYKLRVCCCDTAPWDTMWLTEHNG